MILIRISAVVVAVAVMLAGILQWKIVAARNSNWEGRTRWLIALVAAYGSLTSVYAATTGISVRDVLRGRPLGRDPQKLFGWLQQNTDWISYPGVLRGPVGALQDRQGNSPDRALLLATLLEKVGHTVRLAQGQISREAAAVQYLDHLRSCTPYTYRYPEPLAHSIGEITIRGKSGDACKVFFRVPNSYMAECAFSAAAIKALASQAKYRKARTGKFNASLDASFSEAEGKRFFSECHRVFFPGPARPSQVRKP